MGNDCAESGGNSSDASMANVVYLHRWDWKKH